MCQEDLYSFYAVRRPCGLMDESLLNQYIDSVIVPQFPNMNKNTIFDPVTERLNQGPVILKLDAGPGRNAAILKNREEFSERGLINLMGLPNATSAARNGPVIPSIQVCNIRTWQKRTQVMRYGKEKWRTPTSHCILVLGFY